MRAPPRPWVRPPLPPRALTRRASPRPPAAHPVLFNSLYDPLGASANMPAEKKERRLRAEINNGRLAMLGIFGFLCAQTIPGSVPALAGVVAPYAGEVMAPFEGNLCATGGVLFC